MSPMSRLHREEPGKFPERVEPACRAAHYQGLPSLASDRDSRLLVHVRRTVDEHVSFPTVDQVKDAITRLSQVSKGVRVDQIGNSRMREPLRVVSMGAGSRHVLVIAGAHANEPVGFHTMLALAGLLSEMPAFADGWTWHFLPVWDPDAASLNRWYTGQLTAWRYYRGFYRPAVGGQPGFTFPVSSAGRVFDRPLPETWAVMHLIDRLHPDLVLDLHNGEIDSRAWFILNRRWEGLAEGLRSVAARGGLSMADTTSEYVGWESDGPGVFIEPETAPYGQLSTPYGASLNQYLTRLTLSVTPEVPLFRTRLPQPPPDGPGKGLTQVAGEMDASAEILTDCRASVSSDLTVRTPFEPAAMLQIDWGRRLAARARDWPSEPTPADYASETRTMHQIRLRAAGLLLRMLAAETAAGNQAPAIRAATTQLDVQFNEWFTSFEEMLNPQPLPIEDLVQVQANTALLAADHLRTANP